MGLLNSIPIMSNAVLKMTALLDASNMTITRKKYLKYNSIPKFEYDCAVKF